VKHLVAFALFAANALLCAMAHAATYTLPDAPDSVVGELQYVTARYEDTLMELGRKYGVGYEEIVAANPGIDPWLPGEGTQVLIPTRYVLPNAPRQGIVVNIAEHRVYYFPKPAAGQKPTVQTYPAAIGKMDWKTPLGLTRVVAKQARPFWYPPESVRQEHAARGDYLPKAIPPGPNNPLGEFAMRLGIPGGSYLIHGTNKPVGIGMDVTHGCIRMFPEDIEFFFKEVAVNTPVLIVDQSNKMGWSQGQLYMEVHRPIDTSTGATTSNSGDLTELTRMIVTATQEQTARIDWNDAEFIFEHPTGVPTAVKMTNSTAAHENALETSSLSIR